MQTGVQRRGGAIERAVGSFCDTPGMHVRIGHDMKKHNNHTTNNSHLLYFFLLARQLLQTQSHLRRLQLLNRHRPRLPRPLLHFAYKPPGGRHGLLVPGPPHNILNHQPQYPTINAQEHQTRAPQPHPRAPALHLERVALAQPERLRGYPSDEGGETEARTAREGAAGQVDGEEDEEPEEILGGGDFVEGDEGEGLGEEGGREVGGGGGEGDEEGGEEKLGEECEG